MKRLVACCLCLLLALAPTAMGAEQEGGLEGELKYMVWGSVVERDIVQSICDAYMELNPGVTVELLHVPADYDTKITTLVAGGSEPDVAYMSEALCYELAENGLLVNLYDLVTREDARFSLEDYVPGVWFQYGPEQLVGRRIGIASWCYYYNVDCAEAAGLEFPDNLEESLDWDTFVDYLKRMTFDRNGNHPDDPEFDPENIEQYGFSFQTEIDPLCAMMNTCGVEFSNAEGTEFTWATEKGIEALQKIADLINVHHVAPTPVQSTSLPGATVTLTSGIVASTIDGNWNCADFAEAGANFDIGALPNMGEPGGLQACGPVVIFKSTKNLELAWDFYQFASDPEYALPFYTSGISIPIIKEWLTDEEKLARWTENDAHPAGYVGGLLEPLTQGARSGVGDTLKNFAQQRDLVLSALQPVWTGEKTAEEVLLELKPQVEAMMQGRYPREY